MPPRRARRPRRRRWKSAWPTWRSRNRRQAPPPRRYSPTRNTRVVGGGVPGRQSSARSVNATVTVPPSEEFEERRHQLRPSHGGQGPRRRVPQRGPAGLHRATRRHGRAHQEETQVEQGRLQGQEGRRVQEEGQAMIAKLWTRPGPAAQCLYPGQTVINAILHPLQFIIIYKL